MELPTERRYYWLFALLALVGLVADQASKYAVFTTLYPREHEQTPQQFDVIPGCFAFKTYYTDQQFPGNEPLSALRTFSGERKPHVNRGALFGFGNPQGEENAILAFFRSMLSYLEDADHGLNTLFAIISLLAIGFIVVWASRPLVAQDRFLSIALGLILGGTLGNLYDRVVFSGVRDFLHCYYDTHIWPDFNIADCCLVCGASVLLVHSFLVGEKNPQPSPTEATAQTAPPLQTAAPANGV